MALLQQGGSALEAVEAATRVLEDDPHFNAGTGSVLTAAGEVEMDALLMEGSSLRAGAVTSVRRVANPISAARAIMEHTPHVLVIGQAAEEVACAAGVPLVEPSSLVTPHRVVQLQSTLAQAAQASAGTGAATMPVPQLTTGLGLDSMTKALLAPAPPVTVPGGGEPCAGDHDTVGAVAIDAQGAVAAAVSTGGLTGKRPGRVGDTPCVGCGGYADNTCGACVTTGVGEHILRVCLARLACEQAERLLPSQDTVADGQGGRVAPSTVPTPACAPAGAPSPDLDPDGLARSAVHSALSIMNRKLPGHPGAGLVYVSPTGGLCAGHASARMSWAAAHASLLPDGSLAGRGFWLVSGVQQAPLGLPDEVPPEGQGHGQAGAQGQAEGHPGRPEAIAALKWKEASQSPLVKVEQGVDAAPVWCSVE